MQLSFNPSIPLLGIYPTLYIQGYTKKHYLQQQKCGNKPNVHEYGYRLSKPWNTYTMEHSGSLIHTYIHTQLHAYTRTHTHMNKEIFYVLIRKKRSAYYKMKKAKCRIVYRVWHFLYKSRKRIYTCNWIWTQEINKGGYLGGQSKTLTATRTGASLLNLCSVILISLLSEPCEHSNCVKQNINNTNDNDNKLKTLAKQALVRGRVATHKMRSIRAERQIIQESSSTSLEGEKRKETIYNHMAQAIFSGHVITLNIQINPSLYNQPHFCK